VEVGFDSDDNGEVAAPVRKRRSLSSPQNEALCRKIWNDLPSRWRYRQYVGQASTCIRLPPMSAIPSMGNIVLPNPPRRGLPQRAKQATTPEEVGQLEQNTYFMRRTGGCGGGGEDDPSLSAHPVVDTCDQFDVHNPRYSVHPSTLAPTSAFCFSWSVVPIFASLEKMQTSRPGFISPPALRQSARHTIQHSRLSSWMKPPKTLLLINFPMTRCARDWMLFFWPWNQFKLSFK
jgi:hypothetical protein